MHRFMQNLQLDAIERSKPVKDRDVWEAIERVLCGLHRLADCLIALAGRVDRLESQLTESNRRAAADPESVPPASPPEAREPAGSPPVS